MITKVRESSGHIDNFDKKKIVASLLKESKLINKLGGNKKLSTKEANFIADEVEKVIDEHNLKYLSAPLIREIACASMIKNENNENGMEEVRRIYTRVGLPVHDLFNIITNPKIENANLVDNAETAHKYVADKVLKEAIMILLPRHLSEAHLSGDIHIHDLEYFMTRSFCMDWDLRNFFFYGLDSSGINKTNVAGPAKNATVAILHASKALGSAQTNYAGGQGYYNFLTFLSPYLKNLSEKEIKQLMQMFLYEISQTMVARGGQSLDGNETIFVIQNEKIYIRKIGDFTEEMIKKYGSIKQNNTDICYIPNDIDVKTISVNIQKGASEIKNIYAVSKHSSNNKIVTLRSKAGDTINITEDHSLYNYNENGDLVTSTPHNMKCVIRNFSSPLDVKYKIGMTLNSNYERSKHPNNSRENDIPLEIKITPAFCKFIGLMVSDGNVNDNLIRIGKPFKEIIEFVSDFIHSEINSNISLSMIGRSISFTNKGFASFLRDFIINGASEKYIPYFIMYGDNQIKTEFLNGYLSGDGSIQTNTGRMTFSTTSIKLIGHLHLIFSSLGIPYTPSHVREKDEKVTIKEIETQRNYTLYEFEIPKKYTNIFNVIRSKINNNKVDSEIDQQRYDYYFIKNVIKKLRLKFDHSDWQLKSSKRKIKLKQINDLISRNPEYTNLFKKWKMNIPYEIKEIKNTSVNGDCVYDLSVVDNENFITTTGILCHNTVFSSIQLTPGVPDLWKDKPSVYAGKIHTNEPYSIFEREVRLAFKILMELMIEGDYNGRPFNFPKPEIGFMKEFMEDKNTNTSLPSYDQLYDLVFQLTAKFGTPYFDNMIPDYRNHDEDTIACYQCCAYNFSTNQTKDNTFNDKLYFNKHIGFSMGAWHVVTINCPRIAYKSSPANDYSNYIQGWKQMVDLAVDVFKEKKKFMDIQLKSKRIPFAQQKPKNHTHQSEYSLVDFDKLVWEIGLIGIDDVVRFYTGKSMYEDTTSFELAQYLCLEMKNVVIEKAKESGMNLVLARTPAETTAQRFAVADLINPLYTDDARNIISGDIEKALQDINKTKDLPIYYTNGTHVPVNATCSLIDRLKIEEDFFDILDGGNIHHIFLSENYPDPKGLKEFTMNIIKKTKIGYFAFTKILTVCNECYHVEQGNHITCLNCGSKNIDYISRITGYQSNLASWNEAKKQEFKDRNMYSITR